MFKFPASIQNLIIQFTKLPGIGPKTAERLVYFLIKQNNGQMNDLAEALKQAANTITYCSICYNLAEKNPCFICSDPNRDKSTICVIAEAHDQAAIESIGDYNGLFHVLGGTLSPIEGITPDKLKIEELLARIQKNKIKEIILALNPDLSGETTILYLTNLLKPFKIKITRLARGLPMGADLEYSDEVTLSNALKNRNEIR